MTNVDKLTIKKLHELFEKKTISPSELLLETMQRARDAEPKINAFRDFTSEYAIESARVADIKAFKGQSNSPILGIPFSVKDRVDSPLSLYAASKKSCELITECYANLFKINCIGLRFFTVYGPWGRPDMATYIFTKNIIEKKHIDVFNNGKMKRDFTYIDDIVSGILGAIKRKDQNKYHSIYNLGNNNSENLMDFIKIIENELSIKAKINFLPLQQGDVIKTFADIKKSISDLKFRPKTKISEGIPKFVKWYKDYHEFR